MEPGSIRAKIVGAQRMKQSLDNKRFASEHSHPLQPQKALQRTDPAVSLPDNFGYRTTVIGDSGKSPGGLPAARLPAVIL